MEQAADTATWNRTMPVLNPKALLDNRVEAIRTYHTDTGIKRAELDVSGGIDSAVMAGLLVLALGADKCTFVHLGINSNPVQTDRAKRLIDSIGAKLAVGDFTAEYESIVGNIARTLALAGYDMTAIKARIDKDPTIMGSIRSTLRAPLGRAFNRITGGGIRHGTGNECEDRFLRFYQKGGDGEVDTNPIAMLSKAEVYQLAYALGEHFAFLEKSLFTATRVMLAYLDTIRAVPSADLWANGNVHNDEAEIKAWLGADFTYGRLNPDTGKVVNVGTIERVARFLDEDIPFTPTSGKSHTDKSTRTWQEKALFDAGTYIGFIDPAVLGVAIKSKAFQGSGLSGEAITTLLFATRKAERQTRHKANPNIPTLGTRKELVGAGILSDNFADYGI